MMRPAPFVAVLAVAVAACGGPQVTTVIPDPPERPPVTVGVPEVSRPASPTAERAPLPFDPDTVSFSRFDTGRMWTFDNPPRAYLRETYGFVPDDRWFERARRGALRFAEYCSASFVSPEGLILTNHHCAREAITAVTQEGEDLAATGFLASTRAEERRVPDLFVEQLTEIIDVTEEVDAAVRRGQTAAERASARAEAGRAIEQRLLAQRGGEAAGIRVQVVSFYAGARSSAYVYRRFDDVRLAFAPEQAIGFFGGDPDNFTYPRYTLDFALFRAYDAQNRPVDSRDFHFTWSPAGTQEGELVFVVGNPGSTTRLQTLAELELRRDVHEPAILRLVATRAAVYEAFLAEHPDHPRAAAIRDDYFSLSNARKAYTGRVAGLRDPYILARRAAAERAFREAIAANDAAREEVGDAFERIARNRREAAQLAASYGAFLGMNPGAPTSSNVLARGLFAHAFGRTRSPQLRETALRAEEDRPEALELALIEAKLDDLVYYFGEDDPVVQQVLRGRSPAETARAIYDGSQLRTQEGIRELLDSGNPATSNDPAIQFARAIFPRYADLQQRTAALESQLQELSGQLARARFMVFGEDIPPDATFTLRLNDGVVRGYPYNGTVAPPYTTFWGMYDRHVGHAGTALEEHFTLPERWLPVPEALELATPYNFVTTNDIIGGNSGSPMLNRDLQIVGVAFDGNIESLPGDFIYLPERNRTVGVDSRAMLHALEAVYGATALVAELRPGAAVQAPPAGAASALEGAAWRLVAMSGGPAISTTARGPVHLRFDGARVSGSGGCNRFFGDFSLSGQRVSFSRIASTQMYCEGAMELEQAFVGALEAAARYERRNGTLILFGRDGAELARFVRDPALATD